MSYLRVCRWRLAGAERGSRVSQTAPDAFCDWVRATEHAPRGRFNLLERRHGLAEIGEDSDPSGSRKED